MRSPRKAGGEGGIREHLAGFEGNAPGLEQGGQRGGGGRAAHAHHRIAAAGHLRGHREGIEAGDDGAAVEQVLVHGELGLRRDAGRMEQQQHLDFLGIDFLGFHRHVHQFEGLLELLIDHPRLCGRWPGIRAGRP
jgi:hypothetical protein